MYTCTAVCMNRSTLLERDTKSSKRDSVCRKDHINKDLDIWLAYDKQSLTEYFIYIRRELRH